MKTYISIILITGLVLGQKVAVWEQNPAEVLTHVQLQRSELPRDLLLQNADGSLQEYGRCGTIHPAPENAIPAPDPSVWLPLQNRDLLRNLQIPVAFHVIHASDGTGMLPESAIYDQITVLTDAYAFMGLSFTISSIDFTENTSWFYNDPEYTYKPILAINPATTLNIYTTTAQGYLGYAYFPNSFAEDSAMHGVVLHWQSLPGVHTWSYDEGDTGTHEVGHYLGLYHTFQDGCTAPGDHVDDTPAQNDGDNIYDCTPADTCPSDAGNDPIHNYMNYTDDACIYEITNGQWDRINFMISTYRPNLGTSELIIEGCTDPTAINYNPDATFDDGSCEYESTPSFGDINLDGQTNVIDVVYLVDIILNDFDYNSSGDFNNDGVNNVVDIVALVDIILNPSSVGCTDPSAINYNPESYYEDGSCEYGEGTCTDVDGNVYETVQIGTQLWMAENLKVTHYRDGTPIPNITNNSEWGDLLTGAYGIYENNPTNADTYGNLYNWYAVDDARDVCPEGFHVPSDEEWMELEMALGMSYSEAHNTDYRGTNEGSKLAGNADLWAAGALENNSEFGTSDFTALPGGYRGYSNGYYFSMGDYGYFWSSTAYDSSNAWYRGLYCGSSDVDRSYDYKQYGFSIRCAGN